MPDRPIGRGLDPLPGEELGGFLLRLAAHLNMAPLALAKYVRLLPQRQGRIDRKLLLVDIPDESASMMRLTAQEARSLTFLDWQDRYPPIAQYAAREPASLHKPGAFDPWLFNTSLRHCPFCLSGDKSLIDERYGGGWSKYWRLPVFFGCLEHGVLLRDDCGADHATRFRPPLIDRSTRGGFHPNQCRRAGAGQYGRGSAICGSRLDANPDAEQLTSGHRDAQRRILTCFDPATPAADATRLLTELRIVTSLLAAAWPATDHLSAATDRAVIGHSRLAPSTNNKIDKPPTTAAAAAALYATAIAVLDDPERLVDLASCLQSIRVKTPSASPWTKTITRNLPMCSTVVREILEPITFEFRRVKGNGRSGGPKLPSRPPSSSGYRPEHIPAFLEESWYREHLAAIGGGRLVPSIRRLAAAVLVQWSAGGSRTDAAQYLGFKSAGRIYVPPERVYRCLSEAGPDRFDEAVHALADHLDSRPTLIDYKRRREALKGWVLTAEQWQSIVERMPEGRVPMILDDTTWQIASATVWATVTCGERRFAPRPYAAGWPAQKARWPPGRSSALVQFARPDPTRRYRLLLTMLDEHAAFLADRIDRGLAIR